MLEVEAITLSAGDEFTKDNGKTWLTVKVVRIPFRGNRVIVIDKNDKEHILKPEQQIIVKV